MVTEVRMRPRKGVIKVVVGRRETLPGAGCLGVAKFLCPHQLEESGFSGLGWGTWKEAFLALVWSKCGWVGSHPEVCSSWSWVGHGEGPGRQQFFRSTKEALWGVRVGVTRGGMQMLVNI